MNTHAKSTIVALVAGLTAGVFLSGCASSNRIADDDEQTHAYAEGMMCPKCETVWVRERNRHGPRSVTRLSHSRETTCPDCDVMARSQLLEDGKVMLHACPTCKITPKPVQSQEDAPYDEPSG